LLQGPAVSDRGYSCGIDKGDLNRRKRGSTFRRVILPSQKVKAASSRFALIKRG
jgi:hypothetical protein